MDLTRQPSPLEILIRAQERIQKGWCKRHLAVDGAGISVDFLSPEAVRWCVIGALWAANGSSVNGAKNGGKELGTVYALLTKTLVDEKDPVMLLSELSTWQDHPDRRKDEVLALFDQAIKELG
jgi:hypothetical protein